MNDVNTSNLHWSTNHFVQSSKSDDHTQLYKTIFELDIDTDKIVTVILMVSSSIQTS